MNMRNNAATGREGAGSAPESVAAAAPAESLATRLRTLPILCQAEAGAMAHVERVASWRRYGPSELIYSESDPSTDVWFVLGGTVRVFALSLLGRELIIDELGPGEMFGEISAIDGGGRTASVLATTSSSLCSIPAAAFLEAARSTPGAFHALLRALTRTLRRQFMRLREREALSVRLRLCAELLRLSRPRGMSESEGERVVSPPPPHHIIASRIGSSRETVSRELGELEKEGLVHRSHGAFVLPAPQALQQALGVELKVGSLPRETGFEAAAERRRYHLHREAQARLRQLLREYVPLALVAFLAGCSGGVIAGGTTSQASAPPPGFSADTTAWDGLATGATATEEACRALPNTLWVRADGRTACLRYTMTGVQWPVRTATVHLGGDPDSASYISVGGRVQLHRSGPGQASTFASRRAAAEAVSRRYHTPVIVLARPGMEGSSGHHPSDRHTIAEVHFVNEALSQLKARYGFSSLALAGFSSGGTLAANLLANRPDIRCAALASAPLNLSQFYRGTERSLGDQATLRSDLADPMRSVGQLQSAATIWVIGDPRDRKVPASMWSSWAAEARRHGASVVVAHSAPGPDEGRNPRESYHRDTGLALRMAGACAVGRRMRIDQTALPSRAANQRGTDTSGTARDGLVTDTADPTMAGTNAGVLQPAETPSAGTAAAPADLVVIDLLSPNAADATSPVPDVSNLDQTGAEFEVQDTIDDAEQLGR